MTTISTVGVIGAGTMGHGIAQVAAQGGCTTFVYDVKRDLAVKGLARIAENLKVGVEKKKVAPEARDAALAKLKATDNLRELDRCDLVIEAAPEDLALKQK